ncbi:MAG: PD-(D/E)XK nuclease family protein [Chloroherpetonaceae bacterium]
MAYIIYNDAFNLFYSDQIKDFCNFENVLNNFIEKDNLENLHLILPTQRIIRYLQLQLINKYFDCHKKPLSNYNFYNLENFINLLFSKIEHIAENQEISDALRLIIFEEAFSKANLEFYNQKNNRAKYEIIRRLNELVYGIREDGFNKFEAENELKLIKTDNYPEEIEPKKYSDILKLLIEYENSLGDKLFDKPAKLNKIIEFLNNHTDENILEFYDKIFNNNQLVLAYGFSEFKMPEVDLLSFFSKSNTPFALILDFSPDNGPLFGNFFDYIEKFVNNGFSVYSDDKIFDETDQYLSLEGYDNYFFRKHLFHFDNKDIIHLNKPIKLIAAQNAQDEVLKVAKFVKYLHIKREIQLKDIAIVSRNPDDYSDYFREIFRIEKIPSNITNRFWLWKSPIVNKIFAFIEFAINGYKINILKRLFNNLYFNFDFKIDINNLVYLANELRLQPRFYPVTAEYWLKSLESYKSFYRHSIDKQEDEHERYRMEKLYKKIEQGISDIHTIQDNLVLTNTKMSGREFQDFIYKNIILKFKFKENLHKKIKKIIEIGDGSYQNLYEDIEKEAKGLKKFLEVVNDIAYMFETRSSEKFTLKEWYERLKIGVYNERFQISQKIDYGVDITSIEQIRYLPYKVKILCGASEGVFPAAYSPEKLFGKELPDAKQRHIRTERVLFYQFLSSSKFLFPNSENGELYIFYPKTADKYQIPASPFIDSLKSIVDFEEGSILELTDSDETFSAITNEAELFNHLGGKFYKKISQMNDSPIQQQLPEQISNYIQKYNLLSELIYHYDMKSTSVPDVLNVKIADNLIKDRYRDKSYSISELETYAKCPYKYYVKYVLYFEDVRKRGMTLEPIELGSFLHKILYEFYQELVKNNISVVDLIYSDGNEHSLMLKGLKLTSDYHDFYKDMLYKIAQKTLEMPVKDYQILNYQIKQITDFTYTRNLLYNWLKFEINKAWTFIPAYFEKQFNVELKKEENSDETSGLSPDAESLKVNGKIDRIEVNFENEGPEFAVADYKLSSYSIPEKREIISDYVSFQMPIYMLGFRQLMINTNQIKFIPAFGVYYLLDPAKKKSTEPFTIVLCNNDLTLRSSNLCKKPTSQTNFPSLEEELDKSLEKAIGIKNHIVLGEFPVKPYDEKKACTFCSFFTICRIRLK